MHKLWPGAQINMVQIFMEHQEGNDPISLFPSCKEGNEACLTELWGGEIYIKQLARALVFGAPCGRQPLNGPWWLSPPG